jgi:hypothetical protein
LKNFDDDVGEFARRAIPGKPSGKSYLMAMRKKTFLHPIARFAAYFMIKIPPME